MCEMLGVSEYFLYDPREEYLNPPLQALLEAAEARPAETRARLDRG